MYDGTTTYQTLTITIRHECYQATIAAGTAQTISYTVLSGSQTTTYSPDPFVIASEPAGATCFNFVF